MNLQILVGLGLFVYKTYDDGSCWEIVKRPDGAVEVV